MSDEVAPAPPPAHSARPTALELVGRYVPIVRWLPAYDRADLRIDAIAGVVSWGVMVPVAMAYAGLAGVPPELGLVTAFTALTAYAIFGTSRHLKVTASSSIAIMSASVVGAIAASQVAGNYVVLSAGLALAVGAILVVAGAMRLGFLSQFLAASVVTGFVIGLAVRHHRRPDPGAARDPGSERDHHREARRDRPAARRRRRLHRHPRDRDAGRHHRPEADRPEAPGCARRAHRRDRPVDRAGPAGQGRRGRRRRGDRHPTAEHPEDPHRRHHLPGHGRVRHRVPRAGRIHRRRPVVRRAARLRHRSRPGAHRAGSIERGVPACSAGSRSTPASASQRPARRPAIGPSSRRSSPPALVLATSIVLAPLFRNLPLSVLAAIVIASVLNLVNIAELRRY